jgi:prephenate dehydrogenase
VNRALLEALVAASAKLQDANRLAREGDREDICQLLRQAQWKVAAALADAVPDQSNEVAS